MIAEQTNEKTAKAIEQSKAVISNFNSNNNITSTTKKSKKVGKKNHLTLGSRVRTLSLKFYDEQLPNGAEDLAKRIRDTDSKIMHIIGIKHDRDYVGDDFWCAAIDKPHYHVILRILNNKRGYVGVLLKGLGIEYRKGIDDILVNEHGVETCGHFDNMTAYLLHMTAQSEEDGKEPYSITEMVSNLTPEEIQQVLDGYIRVGHGGHKVDFETMEELDKQAFQIGHDLKDFDQWYNALDFASRTNAKIRVVRESYQRGVQERANDPNGQNVIRTCIFIHGTPNCGKTYAAKQACQKMGLNYLVVGGGGTGKFDKLKPSHQAIIVDDDIMPNLLNMTDNYITQAYRRNSNNPWWCGKVIIVTSNLTFTEWLDKCGIRDKEWQGKWVDNPHIKALESRFYICEITPAKKLKCLSPSKRGTNLDQQERLDTYLKLRKEYDISLKEYADKVKQEKDTHVNYDMLNLNITPWDEEE